MYSGGYMIDIILNYLKENILSLIIILLNIIIVSMLIYFNIFVEEPIIQDTLEEVEIKEEVPEVEETSVLVDVKGSVKKPGVYEVASQSIVNDCIKLAGGLSNDADTNTINLSKKVVNEMVIYVPKKEEIKKEEPLNDVEINKEDNLETVLENPSINTKVNINSASLSELQTLDGIGEAKAQSIIDYRNQVGLFKDISELMNVSGIGETVFAKIKDNITI